MQKVFQACASHFCSIDKNNDWACMLQAVSLPMLSFQGLDQDLASLLYLALKTSLGTVSDGSVIP